MTTDSPQPRPIRWRIALGILALAAIALIVVWSRDMSRQDHFLKTAFILVITTALLFLWAIFLSRFTGRLRLQIFLVFVALIVLARFSLRITGVTGDLIPIVAFRWKKSPPLKIQNGLRPAPTRNPEVSFPQFLGPNRDGIIPGLHLDTNWTAHPPQELWRHPVGDAWTGFAVANGLAITQEQNENNELVTAYDLLSGAAIWSHSDQARYATTIAGEGPRANPTIASNRVYTLGGSGLLNCLDLATGKAIWSKDLTKEHSTGVPSWGFSGAPLVYNGAVIVNPGGANNQSIVAYDANDGRRLWASGDNNGGYSSPTILNIAGAPQLVFFNSHQVEGYNPTNGASLWTHPWPSGHPHITVPILISTNQLLSSSGYGYGSELIEISSTNSSWKAERVWKSNRLKSKFANLILHNGYVYGLDDGILACLDPKTGERKWHGSRLGHGQLLLVGDVILMTAENGEILLVDPSPNEERIIARHRAFKDKTWNPPALAGQYLLVRNNAEAACYKLPLASK